VYSFWYWLILFVIRDRIARITFDNSDSGEDALAREIE
jgi:hypothetical protein